MREATIARKTTETDIRLSLVLEGEAYRIDTGCGFLDHMLELFARHGGFGLELSCKGDTRVDYHHTVEDIGIVLGQAFRQALGDKRGINRYGSFLLPMDEALGFAAVDVSGRPYLVMDASFREDRIGDYDSFLTREFFRALAFHAGLTLHMRALYGENAHHVAEALFKAAAHALRLAVVPRDGILSTKGSLD